jgi:hypothetical protein
MVICQLYTVLQLPLHLVTFPAIGQNTGGRSLEEI